MDKTLAPDANVLQLDSLISPDLQQSKSSQHVQILENQNELLKEQLEQIQ